MLPLITGAWKYQGGGLQLSTSGAFPWDSDALEMEELMMASPLGRRARTVNMSRLGHALTELGNPTHGDATAVNGPPIKALFVYNSNPAAVAPNQNAVLRGLMREDLFTVVHEQFFTDTAQYADIVLPSTTFLRDQGRAGAAHGHLFVQMSNQAIAPLGEARNNTWVFRELAARMGFTEPCFADTDDEMIDQALGPGMVQRPGARGGLPGSRANGWSAKGTRRWRCRSVPRGTYCLSPPQAGSARRAAAVS